MASEHFSKAQLKTLKKAIEEAELNTSGEIRLHVENRCKEDVLDRASGVFDMLEMHKTEKRNGVLFYLAIKDHKFAILGDAGINTKVEDGFWDEIKQDMLTYLGKGDVVNALSAGITKAGLQLKAHFPFQSDDKNELSDEISFGS